MYSSKIFTIVHVLTFLAVLAAIGLMVLELHAYGALPFVDK